MKTGTELIKDERQRQIEKEGWTPEHDDQHNNEELGSAGACYEIFNGVFPSEPPNQWPWSKKWWKPKGPINNLIRAGALYLAEAERQERLGKEERAKYWHARSFTVANKINEIQKRHLRYTSAEQETGTDS